MLRGVRDGVCEMCMCFARGGVVRFGLYQSCRNRGSVGRVCCGGVWRGGGVVGGLVWKGGVMSVL